MPALWEWGVPESHVHFEAFGPASVKRVSAKTAQPSQPCEVRFERSDRDVDVGRVASARCWSLARRPASRCPPAAGPEAAASA